MAKQQDGYLSAKESRRISKENRRITDQYEKQRKRKNVPESEYLTQMKNPENAVEFDNLHTYFFTDTGVVKSVDGSLEQTCADYRIAGEKGIAARLNDV